MFQHKPISILGSLTVILIMSLCSPWSAMAQFAEQRLIPVAAEQDAGGSDPGNDDDPVYINPIGNASEITLPAHDFAVYGRAPKGYPAAEDTLRDAYTGEGSSEAGIMLQVPYGHIPNSLLREPNSTRMPDLETFFEFGGTLELVTDAKIGEVRYDPRKAGHRHQ